MHVGLHYYTTFGDGAAGGALRAGIQGAGLHLSKMKVKQLADELGAWKATKSGRKRQMQLRLRALIIAAASAET